MIANASVIPNPAGSTPNAARKKKAYVKKPVINDEEGGYGVAQALSDMSKTYKATKALKKKLFRYPPSAVLALADHKPTFNDWKHVAGGAAAGAAGGAAQGALFGSALGPGGTLAGAIGGSIAGSVGGGVTGYLAPKATKAIRKITGRKKKRFTPKTYVPPEPVANQELISNLKDFEECLAIVANAWTDEARAAALETRRRNAALKFRQEGNTYHEPFHHEQKAAEYYRKGMQARRGGTFSRPNEDLAYEYDQLGHMHESASRDEDYNHREAFFHKQVELEQRDLARNPPGHYGSKAGRAILRGTLGSAIGGITGSVVGRTAGGIAGRLAGGALGSTATGIAGGIAGATIGSAILPGVGTVVGGITGAAVGRGVGRVVGRSVVSKVAASKGAAQAAAKAGSATAKAAGKFVPKFVKKAATAASAKAKDMARVAGMSAASPNIVGRQVGAAAGQKVGATIGSISGGLTGSVVGSTIGYKSGWKAAKRDAAQTYLDMAEEAKSAYEYHRLRSGETLNSLLTAGPKLGWKIQKKLIMSSPGARVLKKLKNKLAQPTDQATLDQAKQAAAKYKA